MVFGVLVVVGKGRPENRVGVHEAKGGQSGGIKGWWRAAKKVTGWRAGGCEDLVGRFWGRVVAR